jgi:hypothetical protein
VSQTPPPGGYPGHPGYQGYVPPPDHPRATTVLVLGIVGLVACQVAGPFAWVMGARAKREMDAAPGRYGGRGQVVAGYVCGIVATVGLVFYALLAIVVVVVLASNPGIFDEAGY